MAWRVRTATPDDLGSIAAITKRYRRQLAGWEPRFWPAADDADTAHEQRLRQAVEAADGRAHVLVSDDAVDVDGGTATVGCAVARPQAGWRQVDEFAAADDGWWRDGMAQLLKAVGQRDVLVPVPRADVRKAACCATVGMRPRSACWTLPPDDTASPANVQRVSADSVSGSLPPAAPHTLGDPVDPRANDAVVLSDGAGGSTVVGSAESSPMGAAGSTALVDRVGGTAPGALVDAAIEVAGERGDARLVVVCADDEPALEGALVDRGFHRLVDVYGWAGQSATR